MKKILLITFVIISGQLFAQTGSLYLFEAVGQQYVDIATKESIVKVSRSYVVCDKESGETYKRNGRNDFNEVHSFGIRIKGGLVVPSIIERPWENDTAFVKYRNWYDGVARRFAAEIPDGNVVIDSNVNIIRCHKDNLLYLVSLDNQKDGLKIDTSTGKIDGWIVMMVIDKDSSTSITSFRKEAVLSLDKDIVEIDKPHVSSDIIGGIFVKPVYPSLGVIEFRLCGVVMDGGEKLLIVKPSIKSVSSKTDEKKTEQLGTEQSQRPSLNGLSPVPATPGRAIDRGKKKGKKK